ncbi:MAG: NADH-quinone oxidoreductase subunit N, partial [Candidatus Omnitrophica bacterium]|nr:NADH-quinone oxidoreductase subunit N [Candidatus Omnitrophota bacterium]
MLKPTLLYLLGPEAAISILAAGLLAITVAPKGLRDKALMPWVLSVSLLAAVLGFSSAGASAVLFGETYQIDALSQFFKGLLSLILFLSAAFSRDLPADEERRPELFVFLATATLGMMILTSAVELLVFYVGLELSSYSLYVAVPIFRRRLAAEASLKYILSGAVQSAVLLYGMSLLLGLSGTTVFARMHAAAGPLFFLAVFMFLSGVLFKLSAFPFHFWVPDVYEAAPTTVTTVIATASKAAAAAVLLRILPALGVSGPLVTLFVWLAVLSMIIGNTAALIQKDAKRLLAYSSIAQAGYLLVAFTSGSAEGYTAVFFYAAVYAVMNLGVFLVLTAVARQAGTDRPQLSDFDGLFDRSPLLAVVLLLGLLSLAGIPPLAGFTGKWFM